MSARKHPPDFVLALLLAIGLYLWQRTTFPLWMVDLFPQQLGAYFWKQGEAEWIYTPVQKNEAWVQHRAPVAEKLGSEGDPNTFLYPPFVAAMLAPVSDYPARAWRDTLFGINVVLIFVIAWQTLLAAGGSRGVRSYLWALALVLLTYPLARATKLGQIVPLLSVVTWSALLSFRRGKTRLASVLLGFISAVKIFPFALIALPLLSRRLKSVVIFSGTTALILVGSLLTLGWRVHQYWWQVMDEFKGLVQPFFGNQAPLGWFARVYYRRCWLDVIPFTTPLIDALRVASLVVFLGPTLLVLWRIRKRIFDDAFVLAVGLLLSGVHLALPVMWEHYWLFLLPALGWAIRDVCVQRDHRFWKLWLFAAAFLFTMKLTRFYGDTVFGEIMSGSQMFGMAMFWVWLMRRAFRWHRLPLFTPQVARCASDTPTGY